MYKIPKIRQVDELSDTVLRPDTVSGSAKPVEDVVSNKKINPILVAFLAREITQNELRGELEFIVVGFSLGERRELARILSCVQDRDLNRLSEPLDDNFIKEVCGADALS